MGLISKIFGTYSDRQIKSVTPMVNKIDDLDNDMQKLSNDELKNKTTEFRERLNNGETLDDILVEAFAVVREASFRTLGLKPYREQLMGGIILHQGRIAEMKTGEGKTLVATLPAYLNALGGKGVHIVTVNDYLAKRDRDQMSQLYGFLGLETGVLVHGITQEERRAAYNCDITYGTNSEYGFDYLRDNMVVYSSEKVQRTLNFSIVDEVDSILIDEARTPLIISGRGDKSTDFYKVADFFVKTLVKEEDFTTDEKSKSVILTDKGIEKAEKYYHIDNYADADNMSIQHHTVQALKANYMMINEVDYIVRDNAVQIVDEFTGRVMEGRRYSDGLHQAIEAKEGVKIESESKTLASITYQNYFRMYSKLSGMTGTALTEENEFREIYGLDVVEVPTHEPIKRIDNPDLIYKTIKGKYTAIADEIVEINKRGQPILVGTISIDKSEALSSLLKKRGIKHQVLNAKYHEKEAEIIACAGEFGAVTIATNMAGRGTDIKLDPRALEAGGLMIIGTERHESRRIDNQLRGRSGRQGDAGESRFYVSLEDDLMRIFGSEKLQGVVERIGLEEDEAIESRMVSSAIESAQKKVEANNFDVRKTLIQYDDVMNQQREIIYSQRASVLAGDNLKEYIMSMIEDIIDTGVNGHLSGVVESYEEELSSLVTYLDDIFNLRGEITKEDLLEKSNEEIISIYKDKALEVYNKREEEFSDEIREVERVVLLRVVDSKWMDHIDAMDHLKQFIGLRSFKQQDPVQAYQFEGSDMFEEMIQNIKLDTVKYLYHIQIEKKQPIEREQVAVETSTNYDGGSTDPVTRSEPKIGRNDSCPCGSGKKYKSCCGRG